MADVSLDDLIKQDREKHKQNKVNNKPKQQQQPNKFNKNNRQDRQDRPNSNPPRQDNQQPPKQKFIKKQFEDRRPKQDNREPREERAPKPQKEQKKEPVEQRERIVKTLKVMGLSPEFTNEDLYKLFATEGAMQKCLIEQDNFGRTLTTAIVKYHSPESAASAISNLNRHKIMNCVLTVEPYKNVKKND